ncbi:MAG: mechanosensitive ion channel [Gammaproteobacteria bacterium]|nr:mechanosensitive ion channel [Gammaproteobacteria bacterium]
MQDFLQEFGNIVGATTGNLLVALAILIIGWILAFLASSLIRKGTSSSGLSRRIAGMIGEEEKSSEVDKWAGRAAFWIIILVALVAVFDRLELTGAAQPINAFLNQLFVFAPKLVAAVALLLIAWALATAIRFAVGRGLKATSLDKRLAAQAGIEEPSRESVSDALGNVGYWLTFVLFLPAVLGALEMEGLLGPVERMIDEVLAMLPNVFAAGLLLLIGWFIARLLRQITTSLLTAAGTDRAGERIGLMSTPDGRSLSGIIGTIVYALVMIPAIIAALHALEISAISDPAIEMLTALLAAIPLVFGAAVVLGIAYFVGKLVSELVTDVLSGVGFDDVLERIGLAQLGTETRRTPSQIAGYLVLVAIILFSAIEAAELMGFTVLADLITRFIQFAANVVLAVVVFGLGLYFANLAHNVVSSTGGAQAPMLAQGARVAIMIFAFALALRQTGIADDIVNLAFGLLLGAVAIAAAIAFGIGGKDMAARAIERWSKPFEQSRQD